MTRHIEYDPYTKMSVDYLDDGEGGLVVQERQDVTDVLELSEAQFAALEHKARLTTLGDKQFGVHAGRIPLQVVGELMRQGIWQDDNALMKWLEDRDHLKMRTTKGRFSK